MRVKAAVLRGFKETLSVEEVELRGPREGEVLVKVKASGICHSDLSVKNGVITAWPPPTILGHEGAGEILEVGEGVKNFKVGDHVILNNMAECGKCKQCKSSFSNLCSESGLASQSGSGGNIFKSDTSFVSPFTFLDGKPVDTLFGPASFATHCVVPENFLTPVPKDVPFEEAALIACGVLTGVGCAFYATEVTEGSTCLIFGAGSIGLNIIQGAKVAGASSIICVDINPDKESIARQFGATHFINPTTSTESLPSLIKQITNSNFVDFSYEATGNTSVLETAVSLVHPFWGVCVGVGLCQHDTYAKFPAPTFLIGRTLKGVYLGNSKPVTAGKRILDLYQQKKLQLAPLITHHITLDQINEGFALLERGEAIRVIVTMD